MRTCIVVLGMHRSGTSVLSGLISLLGCNIGVTDTMPKRKDNPKGFFENYRIYKFNQKLLEDNGVSWDEYEFSSDNLDETLFRNYVNQAKEIIEQEFTTDALFFIKDPRMCILFPIWEIALQELNIEIKCVFVHRSALEVALSLKGRNQFTTEKSLMLWSHYFFQSEQKSRKHNRIIVKYNQDFKDLDNLLVALSDFIGVILTDEMRINAQEFYSPKLQNQKLALKNISKEIPDYLKTMVGIILNSELDNHVSIDKIRQDFNNSIKYYLHNEKSLIHNINELNGRNKVLKSEKTKLLREINWLKQQNQKIEIFAKRQSENIAVLNKKTELLQITKQKAVDENTKLRYNNKQLNHDLTGLQHKNNQYRINEIHNLSFNNELKKRLVVADLLLNKVFNDKKFFKKIANSTTSPLIIKHFINSILSSKHRKQTLNDRKTILDSGCFSPLYYMTKYRDVWISGVDPLDHFCQYGWREARDPNPTFNTQKYLQNNSDVRKSNINPLIHFIVFGGKEKRNSGYNSKYGEYDIYNVYSHKFLINDEKTDPKSNQVNIETKSNHSNEKNLLAFNRLKDYYNTKILINELKQEPSVSIIILNRNGLDYLKRLFNAIKQNTLYKNFEIIIVENASTDGSVEYLEQNKLDLPLRIIWNSNNVTFSRGNNQASGIAKGEYLLLLNNDVEPLNGWLTQLVKTILQKSEKKIGSVSAKLIYPYKKNFKNSCKVQHAGIAFVDEIGFYRPYNIGTGQEPLDNYLSDQDHAALTGACLLLHKETYKELGGLDESYNYGYEDVDLGLKLVKAGYRNILSSKAILFHYEFGSQDNDSNELKRQRRLSNIRILNKKWNTFLKKNYWFEKFSNKASIFVERSLTVAFAVTDAGKNIPEGDYFTASELAQEFKCLGWNIVYLRRKYEEWYKIPKEVDVLITLLDAYDLSLLPKRNKRLTTIAWARNWFDRWSINPSINQYDFFFASSELACKYIEENSLQKALLMPIATNPNKFNMEPKEFNKDFLCDYCFTGSYWNDEREIIKFLDPKLFPNFKFNIYGKNWDKIEKFKPFNQGFLPYESIPLVYSNSRIVIDDANRVTKPYGSVNSRVFDALATGTLVITNGVLGSELTFSGKLPSFSSQQELNDLLSLYLNDEDLRLEKVKQLREIVLKKHTYKHRSETIQGILTERFNSPSIAIKIPAPNWEGVHEWGDYHFAVALKKELSKLGYYVIIQILSEWDNQEGNECDSVIVLRGLSRYTLKPNQFNIMWNISHPDKVSINEYNEYNQVFIASQKWAEKIANESKAPVACMLQCTDTDVFNFEKDKTQELSSQILFVGNSRKVHRKIIKDLLPCDFDVSVYGSLWRGIIDDKYIKGNHIHNHKLNKYYRSADILLNDHWDDMREKGFLSNRLFDALAAGVFVISDDVEGLSDVFGESIIAYKNKQDLKNKISHYIQNPELRKAKLLLGNKLVRQKHSFLNRAQLFDEIIKSKLSSKNDINQENPV